MASLLSKFRGSLLGALVGDCLGAPFEGESHINRIHLNNYFCQILDPSLKVPFKPYTDDTAMTKAAAVSLIKNKGFDAKDMAERFTKEFFANPKRGYGQAIVDVFHNLQKTKFQDPYGPAHSQFRGQGSYGNGGSMRVTPAALFAFHHNPNDITGLVNLVTDSSKITHTHKLGYRGAVLQALAIRQALLLSTQDFDPVAFTNQLIQTMEEIDTDDDPEDPIEGGVGKFYVKKLEIVKNFLCSDKVPQHDDIRKQLGVEVSAVHSVPTAIYCFLAAQQPLEEIDAISKFHRVIQFAISLGGDTDTIASMAGAIAGAHQGDGVIPQQFLRHCESADEVVKIADALHDASGLHADRATKTNN